MTCKDCQKPKGLLEKGVWLLQWIQIRWRMTYGPMIKQGKFKEAIKYWKERHQK